MTQHIIECMAIPHGIDADKPPSARSKAQLHHVRQLSTFKLAQGRAASFVECSMGTSGLSVHKQQCRTLSSGDSQGVCYAVILKGKAYWAVVLPIGNMATCNIMQWQCLQQYGNEFSILSQTLLSLAVASVILPCCTSLCCCICYESVPPDDFR